MSQFSVNSSSKSAKSLMSYLKTSIFKSFFDLCDMASLILFCSFDSTILLVVEPATNEFWIPSTKLTGGSSWTSQISKDLLQDIFGCGLPITRILKLNKIWVPAHKLAHVCHIVFEITITVEMKKKNRVAFGKYKGRVRWAGEDELMKFLNNNSLKSPEILFYYSLAKNKSLTVSLTHPSEYMSSGNFTEISENVIVLGNDSIYEQIVDAAELDRTVQEVLFREFLVMCYPATYMGFFIFSKFLLELGWNKDEIPNLFRAADINNRNGISFREFVYFLAAVEPGTTHGGAIAELRCRYIFRYLDKNRANILKRDEMKNLIILVRKSRQQPLDPPRVDKELSECYQSLGIQESYSLNMGEFLKAVGELKIRGTSQIFRAPNSIQKYIKQISEREGDNKTTRMLEGPYTTGGKSISYAKQGEYELALHSVKIQTGGTSINIEQLWNIDNATSLSSMNPPHLNELRRKISTDQFQQTSKSNELLKALRYLTQANKKMTCYTKIENIVFSWGQLDYATVAKDLIDVCAEVREIFKKEPRLLEVTSPVYIMGDLHGNFADLLYFEKILWHVGPGLCPCNLLFLGDYVDRGLYSMEVICYLFCYKLHTPNKVKLLRGNHEIKRVQIQWTFEKECKVKFGDKLGIAVFNAINDAFDTMPLAAVIDGRVFCVHGGIPPPWLCPVAAAINDIPQVLSDPQNESSLAWELMWNDPVRQKSINEKVALELLANEGFAVNTRRGTAHIFSVEALEKFLTANGFTHLVRAHEVVEAGFYLQQKSQLITVFSSSKYCGGQNEAACILADQGKLRLLRLETE